MDIFAYIVKKTILFKVIENNINFVKILIFTDLLTKKRFFQNELRKLRFRRYMDIFAYTVKKTILFKVIQNNINFIKILIFTALLTKHVFFKIFSENIVFVDMLTFSHI